MAGKFRDAIANCSHAIELADRDHRQRLALLDGGNVERAMDSASDSCVQKYKQALGEAARRSQAQDCLQEIYSSQRIVALRSRGNAYAAIHDFVVAMADCKASYQEADRGDPRKRADGKSLALNCLGKIYDGQGRSDAAIDEFTEALVWDDEDAETYYNRADALAASHLKASAARDRARAKTLEQESGPQWGQLCQEAAISNPDSQLAGTLAQCDEAVRLQPGEPATIAARGLVLLRLGETRANGAYFDDAAQDFVAAEGHSKCAFARYGRALVRFRKGDLAGGQRHLGAAERLDLFVAGPFDRLGLYAHSKGRGVNLQAVSATEQRVACLPKQSARSAH